MEAIYELKIVQGNKWMNRTDGAHGVILREFGEQMEYNLRNGITTIVDDYVLTPTHIIEDYKDVIDIFFKDENSTPLLTLNLYGLLQTKLLVVDGTGFKYVVINNKKHPFKVAKKHTEGGLEITKEHKQKIDVIINYLSEIKNMKKYCIIDNCVSSRSLEELHVYDSKEEALYNAENEWCRRSEHDKKECDSYIVGLCNVEVDESGSWKYAEDSNGNVDADIYEVVKKYK